MVVDSLGLRASLCTMCGAIIDHKNSGSHTILFGNLDLQGLNINIQWYSTAARCQGVEFKPTDFPRGLAQKWLILPRSLLVPLTYPHRHPATPLFHPPPILNTLTRPEHVRTTSLQVS